MKTSLFNPRNMGAIPIGDATSFRVWAPHASSVAVVGDFNQWDPQGHPLEREEGGNWAGTVSGAKPAQQYQFEIKNGDRVLRKNDPYAREIHPKSTHSVIYEDTFAWKSPGNVLPNWNEIVLYELHVGTFAAGEEGSPGRFDQVISRLPYLKELGVNAVEIMPPMAFPGERSWGYNLTNPFAVEASYGGPNGLKRLVDAAHQAGIAIVMDVVLNHLGPSDLDLWQFDGWSEKDKGGIYFYNDHRAWTPWGENRPDYGRGEVRQYLRDSALLWLDEFHVDGLRFDSTIFVRNTRGQDNRPAADIAEGWSLMQWINDDARKFFPHCLLIAEDMQQNPWLTKPTGAGGAGFDTQWDSAFVHPVRHAIINSNDGSRSMTDVQRALSFRYNEDFIQRLIFSESHDEVANGQARVPQEIDPNDPKGYFARKRSTLGAGLVMTTPGIPMLFEGQEFLEDGWFRDDKAIDWTKLQQFRGINRLYHDLVHLRRNLHGNTKGLIGPWLRVSHVNDTDKVIAFHRWADGGAKDDVMVIASFSNRVFPEYRLGFPCGGKWLVRFDSDWKGYSPDFQDIGQSDGHFVAKKESYDGYPFSATVAIPAYGLLILSQEVAEAPEPETSPHENPHSPSHDV